MMFDDIFFPVACSSYYLEQAQVKLFSRAANSHYFHLRLISYS